jgi:hypothetical protein
MKVTITFASPNRKNSSSEPTAHERTLADVPSPLATTMAEDYVQYRSDAEDVERCKLYRYERDGDEILVALDFKEVIALTAHDRTAGPVDSPRPSNGPQN